MSLFQKTGKFCLTTVAAVTALSAQAFAGNQLTVDVDRNDETGHMVVTVIYDGCLSSSARVLSDDIAVNVDEATATIRVDGNYAFDETQLIQTADCMGRLHQEFSFEDTAARRFKIFNNGEFVGVEDFTPSIEAEGATCPARFNPKGRSKAPFTRDRYCHWQSLAIDASAPELLTLISTTIGSHPESDSNPYANLELSIEPGAENGLKISMELHGIEDDSVAGQRYRGQATVDENGWRFTSLVMQNLCARGARAGQWTKDACA